MMKEKESRELVNSLIDNEIEGNPTLIFYTSQMDLSYARLVLGGKLSGDPDEEEEAPAPAPAPAQVEVKPEEGEPGAAAAAEGEGGEAAAAPAEGDAAAAAPEAAAPEGEAAAAGEAAAEGEAPAAEGEGEAGAEAPAPVVEAPPPPPPKPPKPAKRQDPAELLQVHVCSAADLPPAACETCVTYFTLVVAEPIARSADAAKVDALMSAALEHGVVPGGSLLSLEQLIHEVYLPMLSASSATPAAAEPSAAGTPSAEASSEFVGNLQKFGSQISHAIQQVSGDFRLTMPPLVIEDPAVACEDYEVVMQLEAALEDWTPAIASALETQLAKQPVGKGPLAEIEFWRARNAALSTLCEQLNTLTLTLTLALTLTLTLTLALTLTPTLTLALALTLTRCEQLNTPNARRMLEVLERVESQLLSGFYGFYSELARDRTSSRGIALQPPSPRCNPPSPRCNSPSPRCNPPTTPCPLTVAPRLPRQASLRSVTSRPRTTSSSSPHSSATSSTSCTARCCRSSTHCPA